MSLEPIACACGRPKKNGSHLTPDALLAREASNAVRPVLWEQRLEEIGEERMALASRLGELAAEADDLRLKIAARAHAETLD